MNSVKEYRRVSTSVYAIQWNGSNLGAVEAAVKGDVRRVTDAVLEVRTVHGWVTVDVGVWLCNGGLDWYPVANTEFHKLYEAVAP